MCYRISIAQCVEVLGTKDGNPKKCHKSWSVWFCNNLYNEEEQLTVLKKGNMFMMAMANALVGIGNTLYGCAGWDLYGDCNGSQHEVSCSLQSFFSNLNVINKIRNSQNNKLDGKRIIDNLYNNIDNCLKNNKNNTFKESLLSYLAAAKTYELLTDHKSAYNIYMQILDAIHTYYRISNINVPPEAIDFCGNITKNAIDCTYWHYDNINCAEIDTIKHELSCKRINDINLQYLSSYPEIEVAVYKYYCIYFQRNCFDPDNEQVQKLRELFDSRQMGQHKLIATLTQNIQNLYLKVLLNEKVLSIIIGEKRYVSLMIDDPKLENTIKCIVDYYINAKIDSRLSPSKWNLLKNVGEEKEQKFCLLDFLVKDSLYCLNRITELIAPLYSTTLYNNAFIGETYEKTFRWNHLLIGMRELFEFAETDNINGFIEDLEFRYSISIKFKKKLIKSLIACRLWLPTLESWKNYNPDGKMRINTFYEKVCPNNNDYLTSSYLTGNAIDFYNRSLEMHTSGKSYKEMMTTLFLLEDDLHNDSNYLNYANEIFLINSGHIYMRRAKMSNYSLRQSRLLDIDKYIK